MPIIPVLWSVLVRSMLPWWWSWWPWWWWTPSGLLFLLLPMDCSLRISDTRASIFFCLILGTVHQLRPSCHWKHHTPSIYPEGCYSNIKTPKPQTIYHSFITFQNHYWLMTQLTNSPWGRWGLSSWPPPAPCWPGTATRGCSSSQTRSEMGRILLYTSPMIDSKIFL